MNISNLIKNTKQKFSNYESSRAAAIKEKLTSLKEKKAKLKAKVKLKKDFQSQKKQIAEAKAYLRSQSPAHKVMKGFAKIGKQIKKNSKKKGEVKSLFNSKF